MSGDICEFAVVLAVRGTNAPAGSGELHSGRLYASGGYGDELQNLPVHADFTAPSYFVAALKYPATDIDYPNSVSHGRETLTQELNWLASQCGEWGPTVFLMGHSQGATVILDTLAGSGLTAAAKASIKGVAVFGDPRYSANQPINAPGSQNGSSGLFPPRDPNQMNALDSYKYWGWPQGGNSQAWVQQIRSYCTEGDFFCDVTNPGVQTAMNIHNSYASTNQVVKAFTWFEYLTTDFN